VPYRSAVTRRGSPRLISVPPVTRVRFAPSPTGSLHVGNALSAVANRRFGDWLLLRIDDTDPARNLSEGEEGVLDDLRWLGVEWDEGPVRQSSRAPRHLEAARAAGLSQRFEGVMLWREDDTPTFHLASVVDDADFGITHVIRGSDHRPNEELHAALHRALGTKAPHVIHHGLVVGDDGKKLSKRAEGATIASLRAAGYPAEAVRAYLEELDLPRHDVHLDLARIRSLSVDVLARMSDEELAERIAIPVEAVALVRGAHDLVEAAALARSVLDPPPAGSADSPETLARFVELRSGMPDYLDKEAAKSLQRELKAVGGNLRALRVSLTGQERGPELWAVLRALPRDEALRRALP
jgi:glutamyl-tRNA synthetase